MKSSVVKTSWKLRIRMWLVMLLLFFVIFALLTIILNLLGLHGSLSFYLIISLVLVFAQYYFGPSIVKHSMGVRPLSESEAPHIHRMVEELSELAGIKKPQVEICSSPAPNAFAYGRTKNGGHICVTDSIVSLLDEEELRAVIGHEMGHIKHSDMIVTTIVSAVPIICYYIAVSFLFSGDNRDNGAFFIVGIVGYVAYLIGQILVLFVSRTREYYADQASVELGNKPSSLVSALYKLSYGAATLRKEDLDNVNTVRAFFINDVNEGRKDIESFKDLDVNKDGKITEEELDRVRRDEIKVSTFDKVTEIFSTHPQMLKRVKALGKLEYEPR